MPAYSSLRTFVEALRTGDTNITRTLRRAVAREGVDVIRDRASVDPHLSDDLRAILARYGMESEEINHIENEWPPEKRNEAREWVLAAVDENRGVAFSWELFAGANPANRFDDPGGPEPVSITFQSPRKGVTLHWPNFGQVKVTR